ncbi:MAG: zinc metalloprotease HtpX [Candidatus Nanoarchaeia archaeon]|nr:zinc metalloprotease HtpX [Candidatus Nanoarchaeia archaeon]
MWNQIKTTLLLGVLMGLFLLVGSFFGRSGLTIALIFGFGFNFIQYFFSDKIVLAMSGAKELSKKDAPKLHKMIENICKKANMPLPLKVALVPSMTPNAFCTGRGPKHYVVAVTQGIMQLLSEKELEGVLAHEISHAKNRDVLVGTIAASIAGVIVYLAHMARWAAIFGGGRDDNGRSNLVSLLLLSILAPIAAILIQLAISRSREYLADSTGAKILKDPHSLSNALKKLHNGVKLRPMKKGNRAIASLYIVNPFTAGAMVSLFSTHPPLNKRVERLESMKF